MDALFPDLLEEKKENALEETTPLEEPMKALKTSTVIFHHGIWKANLWNN